MRTSNPALGLHGDHPVQLRSGDSDDEYATDEDADFDHSDARDSEAEPMSDLDQVGASSVEDAESGNETLTSDSSDEEAADVKGVSFGALAKAQATLASMPKSKKRTLPAPEPLTADISKLSRNTKDVSTVPERPTKRSRQDLTSRTSKHAPTILSSKFPVSRRRIISSPPATAKSRDPRFDPAVTSNTLNANAKSNADKAYSFLTDYQATEILQLKSEIAKSQKVDSEHAAELKKQLMSMEARVRNTETRNKEREILQRHKSQEKQALQDGKKSKPYFLKKSDVKKEIERDRLDSMGKKQRDKMENRKRKREKAKGAKDMPWSRRMVG